MQEESRKIRIAILDNNEIEVLLQMNREGAPVEVTLESYDYILIPGWVWKEVCDSVYRKGYIQELVREGYPIRIVRESQYNKIVDEELTLLKLFGMSISLYGELIRYLRQEILKGNAEDEVDYFYHEWIDKIYDNWPLEGDTFTNGFGLERIKKKNAGEVSIAFLAYALAYQKEKEVEITIWSHDGDCRKCIQEMLKKIRKNKQIQFGSQIEFSYKNFENILLELLEKNYIDIATSEQLIDEIRDERKIHYIRKKEDNTHENREETVENTRFKQMVAENNIIVIW